MRKYFFPKRNLECQQMLNIWRNIGEIRCLAQLSFEWEISITLEDTQIHYLLRWYVMCLKPILSSSFSALFSFQSENSPAKPHITTMALTYQTHLVRPMYFFPRFPRQKCIFMYYAAHDQRFWYVEDVFRRLLHKMHILGQTNLLKERYTMSLINGFKKVISERGKK